MCSPQLRELDNETSECFCQGNGPSVLPKVLLMNTPSGQCLKDLCAFSSRKMCDGIVYIHTACPLPLSSIRTVAKQASGGELSMVLG